MSVEFISLDEYASRALMDDFAVVGIYTAPLRVWCHECKVSHEALDWPVFCRPYWIQPH